MTISPSPVDGGVSLEEIKISGFFKQYIFGWMCDDIGNCIKAKANLAVAALLMSYTENIGALIEGHLGMEGKSHQDFNAFLKFFEFKGDPNYYIGFKIKYQESNSPNVKEVDIYTAFRCGLIHEYAPKPPCTIENYPDNIDGCTLNDPGIGWVTPETFPDLHRSSGYVRPREGAPFLRFYTNAYFRDFKNALRKVHEKIFNQHDQILMKNVKASLERVLGRKIVG
jgi:hypothetical protein